VTIISGDTSSLSMNKNKEGILIIYGRINNFFLR